MGKAVAGVQGKFGRAFIIPNRGLGVDDQPSSSLRSRLNCSLSLLDHMGSHPRSGELPQEALNKFSNNHSDTDRQRRIVTEI